MKKSIFASLRQFHTDRRGAISIMFGLVLVVFVLLIGGVLDFGTALLSRSNLQSSGDAAALSSAIVPSGVNATSVAERYFNANYRANSIVAVSFQDTTYEINSDRSSVQSTAQMNARFLPAGNSQRRIPVGATSEVATASSLPDFDMVLVVDGSGSMGEDVNGNLPPRGPTKVTGLRDAANELINIVMTPEYANIRLGFVEYDNRTKINRVIPLNSAKAAAQSFVRGITPGGSTCGQCGMIDGNRLLSTIAPASTRLDGQTYSPTPRVIFLTDGKQNTSVSPPLGSYSDNDPRVIYTMNLLVDQCKLLKDRGVNVSSIGFGAAAVSDSRNNNALKSCASIGSNGQPQFYYAPTNAELANIFRTIANSSKALRLTK